MNLVNIMNLKKSKKHFRTWHYPHWSRSLSLIRYFKVKSLVYLNFVQPCVQNSSMLSSRDCFQHWVCEKRETFTFCTLNKANNAFPVRGGYYTEVKCSIQHVCPKIFRSWTAPLFCNLCGLTGYYSFSHRFCLHEGISWGIWKRTLFVSFWRRRIYEKCDGDSFCNDYFSMFSEIVLFHAFIRI